MSIDLETKTLLHLGPGFQTSSIAHVDAEHLYIFMREEG